MYVYIYIYIYVCIYISQKRDPCQIWNPKTPMAITWRPILHTWGELRQVTRSPDIYLCDKEEKMLYHWSGTEVQHDPWVVQYVQWQDMTVTEQAMDFDQG